MTLDDLTKPHLSGDAPEFRVRAIGGGRRPDQIAECVVCSALVTYDGASMQNHLSWHEQAKALVK